MVPELRKEEDTEKYQKEGYVLYKRHGSGIEHFPSTVRRDVAALEQEGSVIVHAREARLSIRQRTSTSLW